MMNIEDTIKAFQCCTHTPTDCKNCPQQGPGFGFACRQDMQKLVYHWLKAQEPRVMTLEELSERMTGWLEYMGEVLPVVSGIGVPGVHCFIDTTDRSLALKDVQYNIIWRIWTHEPTQQQREAEKWDAEEV